MGTCARSNGEAHLVFPSLRSPSAAWIKSMRRLLLTTIAIPAAAATALANDEQDCFQGKDPRLRIKVCSEIIRRAPHDATAYHHRAVAHAMAGDIASAIRDYTTVI